MLIPARRGCLRMRVPAPRGGENGRGTRGEWWWDGGRAGRCLGGHGRSGVLSVGSRGPGGLAALGGLGRGGGALRPLAMVRLC